MTIDTMSMAVSLLESRGIFATVEYPSAIHVITGKSELYVFGTANPTFDADIYHLPENFAQGANPIDSIHTDISSDCEDPVLVAETIAETVAWPCQFSCAYCKDILSPGDNVVYTQNADTSIDVFCTDACRQEAKEEISK